MKGRYFTEDDVLHHACCKDATDLRVLDAVIVSHGTPPHVNPVECREVLGGEQSPEMHQSMPTKELRVLDGADTPFNLQLLHS